MKTLGILGGVGPQTTSKVYNSVINFFRNNKYSNYPSMIIYNLPFPFVIENEAIIEGINSEKMIPYLVEGAKILEKSGATFGILPCNTLHKYIEDIRSSVKIPFLSILDETASKLKSLGIKKVGILGSETTIKNKLYDQVLEKEGITLLHPNEDERIRINQIIIELISNNQNKAHAAEIQTICSNLLKNGAESILFACTDLQGLISDIPTSISIIDTTEILIEAAEKELIK